MGKSGLNATFNLILVGLGWPWVGEFVGFMIIFVCFLTQQDLVYRKHPLKSLSIASSEVIKLLIASCDPDGTQVWRQKKTKDRPYQPSKKTHVCRKYVMHDGKQYATPARAARVASCCRRCVRHIGFNTFAIRQNVRKGIFAQQVKGTKLPMEK